MKQIILFLFVLLPFCTFSQVHETFDGPQISADWVGDEGFFIANGQLQFDASRRSKGVSYIRTATPYSNTMEWQFDISFSYKTTNSNHVRIFIYATAAPDSVAYYIQVGHNDKNVSLYSSTSDKTLLLIQGTKQLLSQVPSRVKVKLTLEQYLVSDVYKWKLYTQLEEETCFRKEGEKLVSLCKIRKGGYLNLGCKYQATSLDDIVTAFDNVIVSHQITPTDTIPPVTPDPSPEDLPQLEGIQVLTASTLQFVFSKAVHIEKARFSVSDIGEAIRKSYADETRATVNALFPVALEAGTTYTISYSGITDMTGHALSDYSEEAVLEEEEGDDEDNVEEEEPKEITKGLIRINEVMADPKGLTLLPETEYVELYNTSSSAVSLAGWSFSYGGSAKEIGNIHLPAAGYAVLFRSGRDIQVDADGLSVPMSSFPSALANTGKTLQLLAPSGAVIDEVTYDKATPARSWERASSGEWYLSADPRGGTPGSKNNSQEEDDPLEPDEPDEPDNPDEPELPIASTVQPGEIIFNELLPDPSTGGSEYIELYNRSDKTLSLSGLSVATRKADGTLSTHYPLSSVSHRLASGGYALLTKSVDGVSSFYLIASPEALFEVARLPILANTSSTLVLFRTSDETVIDEVSYSSKWHASSVKDKKGVALERISPEKATQDPTNWTSATEASGYGTPGYRNSQDNAFSEGTDTGISEPVYVEEGNYYLISYLFDQPGYNCHAFIYDTSGRRVAQIANHELLGTTGQFTWDGLLAGGKSPMPGVYIFYAEAYHPQGKVVKCKKAFLMR